MSPSVVQVNPTKDFKVYVYFDDGAIKLYDARSLITQGGVFDQISDIHDFITKCTVLNGTLAWDLSGRFDPADCIDLDPVTLYQYGVSSPDPLAEDVP